MGISGARSRASRPQLGALHQGRKLVQPSPAELRKFQKTASEVLTHKTFQFTLEEVFITAESIRQVIEEHEYTCYQAAFMPDHVHLVMRRHRHYAEQMIEQFPQKSKADFIKAGRRPVNPPSFLMRRSTARSASVR